MPACANCDAPEAASFSDGRLIDGGYGQFDEISLVWLDRSAAVEGALCDACLESLLTQSTIEIYDEPGMFEAGRRPGLAAYQALFEAGADRIRHSFHDLNGTRVYASRPLGGDGWKAIVELRAQLCNDDTFSEVAQREHKQPGILALRTGEAHAISAIALGYGEEDPGFKQAAAQWAARRVEIDDRIERNRQSLLGPMM